MKKLPGVLKLYGFQEGIIVLIILLMGVGIVITKYLIMESNSLVYSQLGSFTAMLSMAIVVDYTFSFFIRYKMLSNFSSSRKLFYNSSIFAILFKSCSTAISGIVIILLERYLYTLKEARQVIVILGSQIQDINFIVLSKVFVLLLSGMLVMWSTTILVSSIGKFQLILMIFAVIVNRTVADILFSTEISINEGLNIFLICIISLIIVVINFSITWLIIKNKSNLTPPWPARISK